MRALFGLIKFMFVLVVALSLSVYFLYKNAFPGPSKPVAHKIKKGSR